jgi:solute:Na+ symporter, SSS family
LLLFFVIVYLLATILIGVWAARRVKSTGDFMLAGRSLPLLLSSSAVFATWFGSETVFGASSEFMQGGMYAVIEDPFGAVLCLVLFGLFFARKLYNLNLLTLGDYFRIRYGKRTELVASFFLALPYTGYIAAQLVAMAIIINVVTGLALWQGVVASCLVVTFYTYVGGMWAVSITDFVQSILIIAGLLVLGIVLAIKAGGPSVVLASAPEGTFRFLPSADLKSILYYVAAWSVLGLGSLPSQDVFQRAMSSKSANVAVYSCFIGGILYLLFAMVPLFISLCTKHLYPESFSADSQVALPEMVLRHTALPIQILFFGSLLSAIMSTTSSAILAPASIFSENLIKPLLANRLTDRKLLFITKICVVVFGVVASIMASLRSNIYELVGESSILSLVSLFVPLTLGLYWRKANGTGAILSMISGILAWLVFEHLLSNDTTANTAVVEQYASLEIPSLIPATVISLVAMVLGSILTKPSARF